MSLNSSPWISGEPIKKRTPSIRKTVKKSPSSEPEEYNYQESNYGKNHVGEDFHATRSDTMVVEETMNLKVNELLEKMTSLNGENDGSSLANFNPISYPAMNIDQESSILP